MSDQKSDREFKDGDYVVYPAHGVGQVLGYEKQEIDGHVIRLLVVSFDRERMILRLPIPRARAAGLRHLSTPEEMTKALESLTVRTRTRRVMWTRRAQEYEAKINSGDPLSIAEVIRDLYKTTLETDQSFSERQVYQAAVERFIRELAAVEQIQEEEAVKRVEEYLLQAA